MLLYVVLGTSHKVKWGRAGKSRGWVTIFSTVEGVGHRKLIAIIKVGHVKICRNFFKGMCIKIHIIKLYSKISCCTIIFECVLNYYA